MIKVLLSAVGGTPSVSFIKHLQTLNYYVIGIDSNKDAVGQFFCDEFHISPYISDEKEYLQLLEGLDFDIFFPWLDEEHILFSTIELPKNLKSKILTSPKKSIEIATSKLKTFSFASEHNILVAPLTQTTPAVMRKDFSRGSKGLRIIKDGEIIPPFDEKSELVQSFIDGVEYTVDILCNESSFYAVPRIRVQASNVSTVAKIDMNQDVIEFCKKITTLLKFNGPINIQVIKQDEKLYLIEINPRLAGTAILSINGGFGILDIAIKQFFSKEFTEPQNIKDGLSLYRFWDEVYV